MKLGRPKRYTIFRNASEIIASCSPTSTTTTTSSSKGNANNSVIIAMANSNMNPAVVSSMSSWLLVPRGRNFRHILATVLCVILMYHVTLLAMPIPATTSTNSFSSSSSSSGSGALFSADNDNNYEINSLPYAAALADCKSCETEETSSSSSNNQISQPQNDGGVVVINNVKEQIEMVGTSVKTGSQADSYNNAEKLNRPDSQPLKKVQFKNGKVKKRDEGGKASNFAPPQPPQPLEASGNSYNYYYTDEIGNGDGKGTVVAVDNANSGGEYGDDNNDSYYESKSNSDNRVAIKSKNNLKKKVFNSKKLLNVQYQKRRKLLDSVFISVKSTKRFHKTRLGPVINTWFNLAKDQTWIFTDDDDPELKHKTNGHVVNTHCQSTHSRQALCCKMSAEFDTFMKSQKSWFCHFDDDNYVNVPALLDLLSKYDHREDWYLGKPSLKIPIKIPHPDNKSEEISFWFATGGAGFCLSRALATRMSPVASGGKFTKLCDSIQLPDDVTMGYIAGHLLGRNLTVIPQFHSHYETMRFLDMKNPYPEITFSYVRYMDDSLNTLEIDGFSEEKDPTRFLSLHCLLFPNFSFCPKNKR